MGNKGCKCRSGYRSATSSVLIVGALIVVAFAAVFAVCSPSGSSDDNSQSWISGGCRVTYDSGAITVTKEGDGVMEDYTQYSAPWHDPSISMNITSITIGDGVTHIGNYAFSNCMNQSLTEVTVPDGVTSIGSNAFTYCTYIKCFVIGAGVSSIGQEAFSVCISLDTVYFNASIDLDTSDNWWKWSSSNILFICANTGGTVSGNTLGTSPVKLDVTVEPYFGYNFKELNTEADGTGTIYTLGSTYTYSGRNVLYAIWSQKTVVEWPEIQSSVYDGTAQTASVPASSMYTVKQNPGGTNVGSYLVTLTLTDPQNCIWPDTQAADRTVDDAFTITQRPATVTADDKSKAAGTPDPELTVHIDGLVGTDEVTYTIARDPGETAGRYAIRVTGEASQGNYAVSFVDGTLTIIDSQYTVTFDVQGHGTAPAPQTVDYGSKAVRPADPSEYGCDFGGWFKTAACTDPWDFEKDTVLGDVTLFAKWTPALFTVTLVSETQDAIKFVYRINGGTPMTYNAPFGVPYGLPLQVIALPADGYAFYCWDNGSQQDSRTVSFVSGDINWSAKSETSFAKVTFHANNGTEDTRFQIFTWGVKLRLMPNEFIHPGGLHFVGWGSSPGSTDVLYNDMSAISADQDTDLYAVWSNAGFRITITQNEHGTICGPEWALARTDATYTIMADDGYMVTDLIVDGKSVGMLGTYTIFNIMADHTITATYGPADRGSETFMDIYGRVVEKSTGYEQEIEIFVTNLSSADNSNIRTATCYFDDVEIISKTELSPAGVKTQSTTSTMMMDSASAVISDEQMKKLVRMTAATQAAAGVGSGASDLVISIITPEGTSTTANAELSIKDDGTLTSITVIGDTGALQLDSRAIAQLAKGTTAKIVVEKADESAMNEKQRRVAQNYTVYDAYVLLDSKRASSIDGTIYLTLPYTLKEGESVSDVHIYYLDDDGQVFYVGGTYQFGSVTAQVDHLSYYFAGQGYKDASSSSYDTAMVLLAVLFLLAILVLLSISLYKYIPKLGDHRFLK